MKTYTHTVEMDTSYPPHKSALVHCNFAHEGDAILFMNIVSTYPINLEDLEHLEQWILEDKEEWK